MSICVYVHDKATALYDLELVYAKMPTWLVTWVRDRNPTSGEEAMRLADQDIHNRDKTKYGHSL